MTSSIGRFADAPVSGGPTGAYAKTLTFMVGGSDENFRYIHPVLCTMGKRESIFHCGPPTAGLVTKQINNYLAAINFIGVSEAMNMALRYGLDPKRLTDVIGVSTGSSYQLVSQNPVKGVVPTASSAKDFEGGFSIELCKGVIEMATQLERDLGAKPVLADAVSWALEEACKDDRCKGKDCRGIYRWIADV